MRRLIVPCACALALLTGAWVGQAYTIFAPIEPIETEDAAATGAVGTVWRFYDAIDLLLRTGDDGALRDVVAPDFVDHVDDPGAPSDRAGLLGYLASLRATHPALRLVPEDVVAQGDRVVARLAPIEDADGTIMGIPLAGASPWPRVDVVRARGGRIAERWGDPAGYAPASTLYSESLTLTYGGDLVPVLQRVTFAPGASNQAFTQKGPAILFLESGDLDVSTRDARGPLSPAVPRFEDATPPGAGNALTLGPGDTFVVPDQVGFAAGSRTGAPAVLLLLTLVQPMQHATTQAADARLVLPDAGVTVRPLAGRSVTLPNSDRVTAGLARVTLAPGMRLAAHEVPGAERVAVDAGTVTATVAGDQFAAWLQDPDGRSTALGPSGRVDEGFGVAVFGVAASTNYRNETDRPVALLLLTLAPELAYAVDPPSRAAALGTAPRRAIGYSASA